MSDKGLVIGIELNENTTQVCAYDFNKDIPKTIELIPNKPVYDNQRSLSELLGKDGEHEADVDGVVSLISLCISESFRQMECNVIDAVCIVTKVNDYDGLSIIKSAIRKIPVKSNRWQIIGKTESFAYYAYSQRKELYAAGVVLMDYDKDGIDIHRLTAKKKDGEDYIIEEQESFSSDKLMNVLNGEANLEDISSELCSFTEGYFGKHMASAVYLTGKGFNTDKLPENFTKIIVNRKKAFMGQNLFVRGACFAALEQVRPRLFDRCVLLVSGRIKVGIETDISERGQLMRFRILKPGFNWFMAERTVDFLLDDVRFITLKIVTPDGKFSDEVIDISEIPYREGKTTRISMNVKFVGEDRCLITIKDKGFGDFFKSSGKVIYKELEFSV
ncbi:MAG: DUF5716 family protein [Eubacteriales bacterium]|nr:DUF5716 family protein [Eubacteriales bacterium]